MSDILLFFVFPVATIIFAVILERLLHCPIQVGAIAFAIYIIVTYVAFDVSFLIYAIAYTIIAYITALLTKLIFKLLKRECEKQSDSERLQNAVESLSENVENLNNALGCMGVNRNNCCCRRNRR